MMSRIRSDEEVAVTTTSPPKARPGLPPATTAQLVLGGLLLVHLVVVEVAFFTVGAGKNATLTVAKFFALHAATLMMLQLILIARLPFLDRRLGMDRLTRWHRWVGFTLFWTVLTHASIVVLGYARLDNAPLLKTFLGLAGVVASLLGMIAATIIVVIAATSGKFLRRRLSYEAWHAIHMAVYLAIFVALTHQFLEGTTFSSPWARAYWWTVWALVIGALVVGRVVIPLRRNARHAFRVAGVVPEGPNATSVYVTGRDLDKLPARAGQFCIWRFPDHNGWWQANPFSLSAAPDGRHLRLTAKAVGTTSAGLRGLQPGSRVFVEGPVRGVHEHAPGGRGHVARRGRRGRHADPRPPRGVDRADGRALPRVERRRRRAARASCRSCAGSAGRGCRCWPGAPGRATRRSRRSSPTSSPRWCPTSPAATSTSAAPRR